MPQAVTRFFRRGVFSRRPRYQTAAAAQARSHAPFPVLLAADPREPERGANRLASADAARRHDPPVLGRHLFLAATGFPRAEAGRADRARGAGPLWGAGDPDADDPAGRAVARERPL